MKTLGSAAIAALLFLLPVSPAHAVLTVEGITYTLTEANTADPLTDRFTLSITGINGATDPKPTRTGIDAIAFNQPTGFTTATVISPGSYTLVMGGLDSDGCKQNAANFFCFDNTLIDENNNPPGIPTTLLGSTATYVFDITTATGDFTGYNPAFKINYVGTANNYDLVSKTIGLNGGTPGQQCATPPCDVTDVPEPGSLVLLGTVLLTSGLALRRRRQG